MARADQADAPHRTQEGIKRATSAATGKEITAAITKSVIIALKEGSKRFLAISAEMLVLDQDGAWSGTSKVECL